LMREGWRRGCRGVFWGAGMRAWVAVRRGFNITIR